MSRMSGPPWIRPQKEISVEEAREMFPRPVWDPPSAAEYPVVDPALPAYFMRIYSATCKKYEGRTHHSTEPVECDCR